MYTKKELEEQLRLVWKKVENTQRGWDLTNSTLKQQEQHITKLNEENRKLKECVTKYRRLAEFNRANAGSAEYIVAQVDDSWVVLKAHLLKDHGYTVLDAESYAEYGKFPGFREARDVATLLNESSEREDNNQ